MISAMALTVHFRFAAPGRPDWKYVLGLELTDPGFDHTVLSEFRTRLITGKAEQLLLDALLTPHSTQFSGKEYHCSSKASRREDLQVEEPVSGRDCASFDFHPTLASVPGPTLIGHQVVEVRHPREKHLLAPFGVMEAFHREQLPLDGVMGLIQQGAGDGHLRVGEHRIPPRLLLLHPAPDAFPVGWPSRGGDVVRKVAQPLAQRKHPQALPLARSVEQRVKLRA